MPYFSAFRRSFSKHLPATPMTFAGLYLALSLLLRLVLWGRFGVPAGVGPAGLPGVLAAGALNDLVELLYLLAPLVLYLVFLPRRLRASGWHRRLFAAAAYLAIFGLLYLQVAEYFFFEEFDSRFNLVAVDYLIYPHEVLGNIRDTYPVFPLLLAIGLLAALLLRWLWPLLRRDLEAPPAAGRGRLLAGHLLLLALAAFTFSTDTLAFSDNRVTNEIAANGVSSLFRAFRTNDLSYDGYYRTIDRQAAFSLIRRELARRSGVGFDSGAGEELSRTHAADPKGLGSVNVVVVVEESLGAGFVGAYGDRRGLTPGFDRLAGEGLLFANSYATGTRTVRGLEAIALSFPPIPSESIIKRPGSEAIANWGRVMQENGYHSSFLYGGYGCFDNMNHFFASNGFAVSDRTDIPQPNFANIWGVSDEDLFRHALDYYDDLQPGGQPFFSIIMTTSNHTPYTFPPGIPGVPAEGGGRKAGVRYADYALDGFLRQAAGHSWFANTLFVIVADHDARVYGRAQVPVERYRIPLLVYAPGLVRPGVCATPTSQIDIAPTVLGMLGLPYRAPFYGQDVLHLPAGPRPILINHNHDVALLENDRLVVLGLNRSVQSYRYEAGRDSLLRIDDDPAQTDLATAYYQTAFALFRAHRYL